MLRTITAFEIATYMGFRDTSEALNQYQVHVRLATGTEFRVVQIGIDKANQVFILHATS